MKQKGIHAGLGQHESKKDQKGPEGNGFYFQ